jgi:hypothetical protein
VTDRNWITRVAAKVNHHHGRDYCGYLTPSEIMNLYKARYVVPSTGRTFDAEWTRKKIAAGESSPSWHYFQITKDTPFSVALANRIPTKR